MTLSTRRLNPETLESILKWHSSQHNQSNRWFLLPVHNVVVVLKCCLEIEEAEVEGEEGGHRDQEQGADIVCDPALGLMKMITLTWSPRVHYLGAPHVAAPQGDDVAHDPGNIGGHDASKYGWCLSSGSQVVTGIWPVDNMCVCIMQRFSDICRDCRNSNLLTKTWWTLFQISKYLFIYFCFIGHFYRFSQPKNV